MSEQIKGRTQTHTYVSMHSELSEKQKSRQTNKGLDREKCCDNMCVWLQFEALSALSGK